jgi:serine/threonine-protein kinase
MATVYLAQDLKHGRKVAIKVLRPELAAFVGEERFLREVATTANLRHPHILPLYDSGEAEGHLFYVMPFVEGETLRQRLNRERTLPLREAVQLAREIADALSYAHRRALVHRDIKPENILLESGHAAVADFGIARAAGAGETDRLTQVGIVIGTPEYMSPEQAVGDTALDGRSDLYALGCVLFEMLTGAVPFTGPNTAQLLVRRFRERPPALRAARPDAPADLEVLVSALLSADPAGRPDSAGTVVRALEAVTTPTPPAGPVLTPAPGGPVLRSLAVLPFLNLSTDTENEYFSDGMTEELIGVLGRSAQLRVAARSSVFAYKGKPEDPRVVGRALEVDSVLSGSIRKAGNRIRLAAELVSVADGQRVWADTFDRELRDVFAVQEEIARAIADALQARLVPTGEGRGRGTENVEAYTHYLRGRYHWSRRTETDLHKALAHYQQALALDPRYALAEVGVADAYNILGFYDWLHPREAFPKALAAANRALALDDSLATAYISRAYVRLYHEWQWAAAEEDFRRAVTQAPGYGTGWHQYGNLLVARGRFAEAVAAMRRSVDCEPLHLVANAAIGWALYYAGNLPEAIAQYQATIELDGTFMLSHLWLGYALVQSGRFDEALTEFETAARIAGRGPIHVAAEARAHAAAGRLIESDRLLVELEAMAHQRFVPGYDIAAVHAAAGDATAAFAQLERAVEEREHELVLLAVDPALAPLRHDPRFARVAGRVGV